MFISRALLKVELEIGLREFGHAEDAVLEFYTSVFNISVYLIAFILHSYKGSNRSVLPFSIKERLRLGGRH